MSKWIRKHIAWEALEPYRPDDLVLSVRHADYIRDAGEVQLDMELNFIIPYDNLNRLSEEIVKKIPDVERVSYRFFYRDMVLKEEDIILLSIPHMMASMEEFRTLCHTSQADRIRITEDSVVVECVGQNVTEQLNRVAAPAMQQMLLHDFHLRRTFAFRNREDICEEKNRAKMEQEKDHVLQIRSECRKAAEAAKQKGTAEPASGGWNGSVSGRAAGSERKNGRKGGYEGPVTDNRIVGKPIQGEVTPIRNLNQDLQNAVIQGTIFRKDARAVKNGRSLALLYMTDYTDSICVKMFVSPKKQEDFDAYLKTGTAVKVQGECQYDTYERSLILMAKSIELTELPKREDRSPRKRVELHAHTNMSQTDGITNVKDLVQTAKRWGHPAVAVTDHGGVQSFPDAASAAKGEIKILYGVEGYLVNDIPMSDGSLDYKSNPAFHIILLAKNQTGLKNLYRLVSYSYLDYYYKRPRMPKSIIREYREGLIIGSACEAGEIYRAITGGASEDELLKLTEFYDYLEIQPRVNNMFMVDTGMVSSEEDILNFNRRVVELGRITGKPVVATCDTHYLNPEDYIYRNIIMAAHGFRNLDEIPKLYFRTTEEMLEEFQYLGQETAEEIVIDNPQKIADMIEVLKPVPEGKYPPQIPNAEEHLRERCYRTAKELYGDPIPDVILQRLEKELTSVIDNGYAVMYVAADMLVQKSLNDGYLVGSRGSVGSSLAARMDGITEVNPLPPHYICPECKYLEWGDTNEYDCGVDMPDRVCPHCGTPLNKDGFNIPFETFLGFKGDKEPDIDLNFAGEYQAVAHRYVGEIFGEKNVFKAGTIGTIQEKTALMYVNKYYEERGRHVNKYEAERLALGCTGVRKTTGQHPGGIVICPEGHEIFEFCPVMHPSEGQIRDIVTTHFDYHKIDENLLKLDILGHDVPSMIRMLQDMTGIAPEDVPLSDPRVNDIFLGTKELNIQIPDYRQTHGTFGIPEFGTSFTRKMLDDTQPKKFSALVRIAGFSHGTDVWINNAHDFILSGQATMDDAIATRDDIMNYLILKGVPKQDSFWIMEHVRKGKGLKEEEEDLMREHDVPEWYIESCKRIKYMFPKAHAVAYVMMSYRIAYFKVYYPAEFYAVYFTMKVDFFNAAVNLQGLPAVLDRMDSIRALGKEASNKEKDEYIIDEVVYEMYARGLEFLPARLGKSHATRFLVEDGKVRIPFRALEGLGETAAVSLVSAYEDGPFRSLEDVTERTQVNQTNLQTLQEHGVLNGLPESDQLSLFSFGIG